MYAQRLSTQLSSSSSEQTTDAPLSARASSPSPRKLTFANGGQSAVPSRMRKHPQQERSFQMVCAIREAALLVFKNHADKRSPSMQEIALRAGASLGSVYQYYSNLESVIAAIYEDIILDQIRRYRLEKNCPVRGSQNVLTDWLKVLDAVFDRDLGKGFYLPLIHTAETLDAVDELLRNGLGSLPMADTYRNAWTDIAPTSYLSVTDR